jgi:hypothetical protein
MQYLKWIGWILPITLYVESYAQKYISTSSYVRFYSEAPVENIEAINEKAQSAIDLKTNEVAFSVPIRGFQFENSLMQEHFNENYMESEQYPRATFRGKIESFEAGKAVPQQVEAVGTMTIHGVQRQIRANGTMSIADGTILLHSEFPVAVAEYDIKIPKVVFYNIAEVVDVTIEFTYEKHDE